MPEESPDYMPGASRGRFKRTTKWHLVTTQGHEPGGTARHEGRPEYPGRQAPDLFCPGTGLESRPHGPIAVREGQSPAGGLNQQT